MPMVNLLKVNGSDLSFMPDVLLQAKINGRLKPNYIEKIGSLNILDRHKVKKSKFDD